MLDIKARLDAALIECTIKDDIIYVGDYFITVEVSGDFWKPEYWVNDCRVLDVDRIVPLVEQCIAEHLQDIAEHELELELCAC
ncbi:hypothetical protein [Paenibacillus sp. MMO-177]|uniref:hypothetical protein n=1 Tax=Paenibacillus sp. MMO-177 TaxID=3081289 RepID=UPI003017F63A